MMAGWYNTQWFSYLVKSGWPDIQVTIWTIKDNVVPYPQTLTSLLWSQGSDWSFLPCPKSEYRVLQSSLFPKPKYMTYLKTYSFSCRHIFITDPSFHLYPFFHLLPYQKTDFSFPKIKLWSYYVLPVTQHLPIEYNPSSYHWCQEPAWSGAIHFSCFFLVVLPT